MKRVSSLHEYWISIARSRNAVVSCLALLVSACGSSNTAQDIREEGTVAKATETLTRTVGPLTYVIDDYPLVTGLSSMKWRGKELLVGAGFGVIASCTGADVEETNVLTRYPYWDTSLTPPRWVMGTADGRKSPCSAPFTITIGEGNPIPVTISVGPTPAFTGALVVFLDMDQSALRWFQFHQGGSHQEGCGTDTITYNTLKGDINAIRKCAIPRVGPVGFARQYANNASYEMLGSAGRVQVRIANASYSGALGPIGHPSTHSGTYEMLNVPAGSTVTLTTYIGVDDQKQLLVADDVLALERPAPSRSYIASSTGSAFALLEPWSQGWASGGSDNYDLLSGDFDGNEGRRAGARKDRRFEPQLRRPQ